MKNSELLKNILSLKDIPDFGIEIDSLPYFYFIKFIGELRKKKNYNLFQKWNKEGQDIKIIINDAYKIKNRIFSITNSVIEIIEQKEDFIFHRNYFDKRSIKKIINLLPRIKIIISCFPKKERKEIVLEKENINKIEKYKDILEENLLNIDWSKERKEIRTFCKKNKLRYKEGKIIYKKGKVKFYWKEDLFLLLNDKKREILFNKIKDVINNYLKQNNVEREEIEIKILPDKNKEIFGWKCQLHYRDGTFSILLVKENTHLQFFKLLRKKYQVKEVIKKYFHYINVEVKDDDYLL